MSDPSHARTLRIGTRGSKLARWQADWVAARLRELGHSVAICEIRTRGDEQQDFPVQSFDAPGAFTKEIQRALVAGEVDVAVHSLKDLPTDLVEGLVLAAVPARESAADVLVVRSGERGARNREQEVLGGESYSTLHAPSSWLPSGARVGTGSLRRKAQLLHVRPDLEIVDIRGNVDTRLAKLDDGQFDGIVLAEAGLRRLQLAERISEVLPYSVMLPAVGQGALGVECRADDAAAQGVLAALDDAATRASVLAERALLAQLRGGCLAPVGALGQVESGRLWLSAAVLNADGSTRLFVEDTGMPAEAEELGRSVAQHLLNLGAAALIAASREGG